MKAPHITASQDISHRPWARRTRLCWVKFIFSSIFGGSLLCTNQRKEEELDKGSRREEEEGVQ